jgi:hypothetical protein
MREQSWKPFSTADKGLLKKPFSKAAATEAPEAY